MQNSAITVARVADSLRSTTAQFVRRAGTRTREESAPELPLWQPTDEGSELVIALRRELLSHILGATLEFVGEQVILQGWVEFGLQEGEQEVQEVDGEGICAYMSVACKGARYKDVQHTEGDQRMD